MLSPTLLLRNAVSKQPFSFSRGFASVPDLGPFVKKLLYQPEQDIVVFNESNFEFSSKLAEALEPKNMISTTRWKMGDNSTKQRGTVEHLKTLKGFNVQVLSLVQPEEILGDDRICGKGKKNRKYYDRLILYHPTSYQDVENFIKTSYQLVKDDDDAAMHIVVEEKTNYTGWDLITILSEYELVADVTPMPWMKHFVIRLKLRGD